jgi:hypothetical protein
MTERVDALFPRHHRPLIILHVGQQSLRIYPITRGAPMHKCNSSEYLLVVAVPLEVDPSFARQISKNFSASSTSKFSLLPAVARQQQSCRHFHVR